jgi:hypothetical protein
MLSLEVVGNSPPIAHQKRNFIMFQERAIGAEATGFQSVPNHLAEKRRPTSTEEKGNLYHGDESSDR